MNRILLNLCWKEYRELRWNVAAMVAITLGIPLYTLVRESELTLFWVSLLFVLYSIIGGIVFGMWGAAGERANRSAAFLHTLPISPQTLGAVKLAATILASLIPIVCLTALGLVVKHYVETSLVRGANVWMFALVGTACLIHITLTTAAFGSGQRTELLAAGRGILVFAIWGAVTVLVALSFVNTNTPVFVPPMFLGPPIYLLGVEREGWDRIPWDVRLGLCETATVMLALAIGYVWRYSTTIQPLASRPKNRAARLAIPSGQGAAMSLVWKQLHESLPLVLMVLAIALLVGLLCGIAFVVFDFRNHAPGTFVERSFWETAVGASLAYFGVVTFLGGFILSLLLGVAAFAADLEPKANTFWRSRPISPTQWFWIKYCVAFASLVLTLGVPPLLIALIFQASGNDVFGPESLQLIGFSALGWFGIFSAGVVSTCIIRRPLHSGLLAFGLAAAGLGLAQWLDEGWFGAEPLKYPLLVAGVWLFAAIAATLIAWWAAVRDAVAFE